MRGKSMSAMGARPGESAGSSRHRNGGLSTSTSPCGPTGELGCAPVGAVRLIVALANAIRKKGESKPSLQELRELLRARELVLSSNDANLLLDAFLVKTERDRQVVDREVGNVGSVLYGELQRV